MSRGVCDVNVADERGELRQAPLLWGFSFTTKSCQCPPFPPPQKPRKKDGIKEALVMWACFMYLLASLSLTFFRALDLTSDQMYDLKAVNWSQCTHFKHSALQKYSYSFELFHVLSCGWRWNKLSAGPLLVMHSQIKNKAGWKMVVVTSCDRKLVSVHGKMDGAQHSL